MTYRNAINKALRDLMAEDGRVILIGQSIRDPYGGACKVTRGLTKHFDGRIFDSPICEDAMIGWAIGLSLQGYVPIVEIMFADFLPLCMNQIFNVGKVIHQYHQPVKVVIRTMINGDKMYGPTHSQSMEYLLGTPQDVVRGPDVAGIYRRAVEDKDHPVNIIVENKQMYDKEVE